eukprot:SAG31_NODE_20963_length_560_cov_10.557484_2_plen_60_part_01
MDAAGWVAKSSTNNNALADAQKSDAALVWWESKTAEQKQDLRKQYKADGVTPAEIAHEVR